MSKSEVWILHIVYINLLNLVELMTATGKKLLYLLAINMIELELWYEKSQIIIA